MEEERNYCVYQHTNLNNNKKYIGITKQIPEHRWGRNGANYKSSPRFYSAIKSVGWDNFSHEIIKTNLTRSEACDLERKLILTLKTQDKKFGYNTTEGGDAPVMPKEVRKKISKALIGNKNSQGVVITEDRKRKISLALKGKTFSDERKRNISISKLGKTHKSPSEETRKKISDAHDKTPVYCLELDKIFPSIQECSRQLGIPATNISKLCKGRGKTLKGYHLSYYKK